jgi:hypothetical protein
MIVLRGFVSQIMRVAVEETLDTKCQVALQADSARTFESHPHSRASGEGAAAGNFRHREDLVPGSRHDVPADVLDRKDSGGLPIKDEACFVMARACELFAMDLAKRSELVLEDGKRARCFLLLVLSMANPKGMALIAHAP